MTSGEPDAPVVTATSRHPVETTQGGAADGAAPTRRSGRGPTARLRIMGWLLLLMGVALLSVVLVTRNLLLGALEHEITAALQQEADEFEQFTREGRNPETGRPFTSAADLLRVHLARQRAGESEVLAGVTTTTADAPLVQGQADAVRAITDPGALDAIVTAAGPTGPLATSQGELRWARVPIQVDGAVTGHFVVGYLVAPERAEVDLAMRILAVVSLLALALAAGASWMAAGQILAPVRVLHRTAVAITEDDLTRRIPVEGNDDIAALADQFNAMLDRLQSAFATQRGFLDDASHELRTPITIVRGTVELMAEDPVERAADIRLCLDELDRMGRMVEDLLVLAKSERPDFLRPQRVEIAELTSDIDAKVRTLGARHWQLENMGEGVAEVDPHRVTQAVVALAQNAVQHTAHADPITIGSALNDGRLSFWVTDRGPGVIAEDAATIFDRFARGSTGGAPAHRAGAGLGLAIVTAIAAAHGGTTRLISTPGKGATFGIELPAPPQPESRGQPG